MTKSISGSLLAELQSGVPIVATCWRIERTDGTVMGFTDWPDEFTYNTVLYKASGGYQRTAIDQKEGLNVDNMDIVGIIDDDSITEEDLLAGIYKGAKVQIFLISPTNLGWGDLKLDYGYIGEITVEKTSFTAEFRSLTTLLSQEFGDKYSRYCRWELGDSNCGIVLKPAAWAASTAYSFGDLVMPTTANGYRYRCTTAGTSNDTEGEPTWDTVLGGTTTETDGVEWETEKSLAAQAAVSVVTSDYIVQTDLTGYADAWFKYGVLTWLTGNNTGYKNDIKDYVEVNGVITLRQKPPFPIIITDTFEVTAGCNHILKMPGDVKGSPYTGDCRVKFNNVINYGGEPELPNIDRIAAPADKAT